MPKIRLKEDAMAWLAILLLLVAICMALYLQFGSARDTITDLLNPGAWKAGLSAVMIDVFFLGGETGIFASKKVRGTAYRLCWTLFIICGLISVGLNTYDWIVKAPDDPVKKMMAGSCGFLVASLLTIGQAALMYLYSEVILPQLSASQGAPEFSHNNSHAGPVPEGMVLVPAPGHGKSKRKRKTDQELEQQPQQSAPTPALFPGKLAPATA